MTAMSRRRPFADRVRRLLRWLIPAALLVLAPKCVLCVLAYVGLGVAVGLGGPEICGATGNAVGHWAAWLSALGAAMGIVGFILRPTKGQREGKADRIRLGACGSAENLRLAGICEVKRDRPGC